MSPPIAISQPITIPSFDDNDRHRSTKPSQSPTPAPDNDDTSYGMRPRSDTMGTTSSAASDPSFHLQTPQTPSILHVLGDNEVFTGSPEQAQRMPRKSSYGFGRDLEQLPVLSSVQGAQGNTSDHSVGVSDGHSGSEIAAMDALDEQEVEASLFPRPQTGQTSTRPGVSVNQIDTSMTFPRQTDQSHLIDPLDTPPAVVPAVRTKSSFGAAVRRKLDRSKSSFKSLKDNSRSRSASPAFSDPEEGGESTDIEPGDERPRKHRFRTLLRSLSHTGSTVSLRSVISANQMEEGQMDQQQLSAPGTSLATAIATSVIDTPTDMLEGGIIARDYVNHSQAGTPLEMPSDIVPQSHSFLGHQLNADDLAGPSITLPRRSKGKERARSTLLKQRPPLLPVLSAGTPAHAYAYSELSTSPIMSRPRALSLPYITTSSVETEDTPVNLFGRMLPRELQLMVLKTMVSTWQCDGSAGRWEGADGGRRELVKLSRVSRSWQSLCLDGQLWSMCDIAPFASSLHANTFERIISSAGSFISTLSLRGLDSLPGPTLLHALSGVSTLPTLTSIDLRGCKSLSDQDICRLLQAAPHLTKLNLRGVQATSAAVLRIMTKTTQHLQELDVSRCWDISLCDVVIWLRFMTDEAAGNLRVLRVGGVKGYSPTATEFLPLVAERLVNLEKLDLQACSTLFDVDFEDFAKAMDLTDRQSTLTHLNLSNCSSLTTETFTHLKGRIPNVTHLELANLPQVFRDDDRGREEQPLIQMLHSVPHLQRLDLESTGSSGHITDRTLNALTPAKYPRDTVVGRELVELRIGYSSGVTPEGIIRLIRGCDNLRVLEADNTAANNAVMRDFMRRRDGPHSALSLVDCRAVTPASYSSFASRTSPRSGFTGWPATIFNYDEGELPEQAKPVLKTFWSWKRVGVPKGWREARADAEQGIDPAGRSKAGETAKYSRWASGRSRRASWWREEEDRGNCTIM